MIFVVIIVVRIIHAKLLQTTSVGRERVIVFFCYTLVFNERKPVETKSEPKINLRKHHNAVRVRSVGTFLIAFYGSRGLLYTTTKERAMGIKIQHHFLKFFQVKCKSS